MQSLLFSATTQLSIAQQTLTEQQLNRAKAEANEKPYIVSLSESPSSSSSAPEPAAHRGARRDHRLPRGRDRDVRLAREPRRPCGARVGPPPPSRRASRSRRPDAGAAVTRRTAPDRRRAPPPPDADRRRRARRGHRRAGRGRPGDRVPRPHRDRPRRRRRRGGARAAVEHPLRRGPRARAHPGPHQGRARARPSWRCTTRARQSPEYGGGPARARNVPAVRVGPPRGRPGVALHEPHAARVPAGRRDGLVVVRHQLRPRLRPRRRHAGELRWARRQQGEIASTPAIAGDGCYVSSMDGRLRPTGSAAGAPRWTFSTRGQPDRELAAGGRRHRLRRRLGRRPLRR